MPLVARFQKSREPFDEPHLRTSGRTPVWLGLACILCLASGLLMASPLMRPRLEGPEPQAQIDRPVARPSAGPDQGTASPGMESAILDAAMSDTSVPRPEPQPATGASALVEPALRTSQDPLAQAADARTGPLTPPLPAAPPKEPAPSDVAAAATPVGGPYEPAPDAPSPVQPAGDVRTASIGDESGTTPPAAPARVEPITIDVPASVRVKEETGFQIGNRLYRLTSVDGLGIDTACEREADGRCVFHPRAALKRAIAGATLQCTPVGEEAEARLVTCTKIREAEKDAAATAAPAPPPAPASSGTVELY